MTAKEPNSRLFRFTGALDIVLAFDGGDRLVAMHPQRRTFRVVMSGIHPSGEGPCIICEFVGGAEDGVGFFLEPGADHPDVWPQIAEDVK